MRSQGEPVLAGVDLDWAYLCPTRDGKAWADCFARLSVRGLKKAAGVSEVFPQAEERDDCFRCALRPSGAPMGVSLREGGGAGALGKIRACDKARRRKGKHALRRARRECAEAMAIRRLRGGDGHAARGAGVCRHRNR